MLCVYVYVREDQAGRNRFFGAKQAAAEARRGGVYISLWSPRFSPASAFPLPFTQRINTSLIHLTYSSPLDSIFSLDTRYSHRRYDQLLLLWGLFGF